MPVSTIDLQSANRLETKGWTKKEYGCAYILFPPGQPIHSNYKFLFEEKTTTDPNQPASKVDLIRALLKEGKTRKEAIEAMLKKFPKGSKAGICSQVYSVAKSL